MTDIIKRLGVFNNLVKYKGVLRPKKFEIHIKPYTCFYTCARTHTELFSMYGLFPINKGKMKSECSENIKREPFASTSRGAIDGNS